MTPILKDLVSPLQVVLNFDGAVTGVAAVLVQPQGLVLGGAPLTAASSFSGNAVTLTLTGGAEGERYTLTPRVHLGATDAEQELAVAVLAKAWAMPDGSAAWLDIHEFVNRFGFDETLSATDNGDGLIDRAFLVAKLQDAQAEAEANIAARYALPLATVPGIIKTAISDLARARLYRRGVPDEVAENAKMQRRLLERIASGALPLPLYSGEAAESATGDAPILFHTSSAASGLEGY